MYLNTFLFFYIYYMINSEELNSYYKKVNVLIDEYIDKWNIKPTRLKKYLKKNSQRLEKFLIKNNLENIPSINKIIQDVISDRISMQRDNILTFESYDTDIKKSKIDIFSGIEKSDIELEKVLADHFDTGLSSIDIIDSEKHIFSIDSWTSEYKVVIFNKEDIEIIKDNILENALCDLEYRRLDLYNFYIDLKSIIDNDKLKDELSKKIDDDYTIKEINNKLLIETNYELSKTKDYYIWIEK